MKFPKLFRREPTLEDAIEHLTNEGYVGYSADGGFYITQKGMDWYYSDAWTDQERRMFEDETI